MISIRDIEGYGFFQISEYFDYIIESRINGRFEQVKSLLGALSFEQYKAFLRYLLENDFDIHAYYLI